MFVTKAVQTTDFGRQSLCLDRNSSLRRSAPSAFWLQTSAVERSCQSNDAHSYRQEDLLIGCFRVDLYRCIDCDRDCGGNLGLLQWPKLQHFIQTVGDVSSSQRIQHRPVSLCSDRLEEFIEVGAYSAAVLDVISRSKIPLLRCCHPINITQRNSLWGVAETQTAAFTDRRNDDPVVCERNEQLSDEARVSMQPLSQHPACASKSVPLR